MGNTTKVSILGLSITAATEDAREQVSTDIPTVSGINDGDHERVCLYELAQDEDRDLARDTAGRLPGLSG